jgi:hypothetical protein
LGKAFWLPQQSHVNPLRPGRQFGGTDRSADQVPLQLGAALPGQVLALYFGLHALSDDQETEAAPHRDHRVDDGCILACLDGPHEGQVERLTDHLVRLERQHHRRAKEGPPPREREQR